MKNLILEKLKCNFGCDFKTATAEKLYMAISLCVRDILMEKKMRFEAKVKQQKAKQVCYLSMEFLIGRSLKNNLFNLGILNEVESCIEKESKISFSDILNIERDAGLGNGGLGRLAACYQDALATGGYPSYGFSILYEYGIFKQKIVDGMQLELPDIWLESGGVWLAKRPDEAVEVRFGGWIEEKWEDGNLKFSHHNYDSVLAIPYDMVISGYNSDAVSTLRLWRAKTKNGIDMNLFSRGEYLRASEYDTMCSAISKVLYPEDAHQPGKTLRLKQQYFFTSATVQYIVSQHKKTYGDLKTLPDYIAIHVNDTHPTVAILELMRILLDEENMTWNEAWEIVTKTFAYTNHTVMAEALEKWSVSLFKTLLPRLYQILCEIDRRFRLMLRDKYQSDAHCVEKMAPISNGEIRMANLCILCSYSTNGVSQLHSEILKETVFSDFYKLYPERFLNVTNGISFRRWCPEANPKLHNLICELIGDKYLKSPEELLKLKEFKDDVNVLLKLKEIKKENKEAFAKKHNILKFEDAIFDVQAKRLHEYKRQLLNVLKILHEYHIILDNPNGVFQPKTYIFAAKAAPGYVVAKRIIKLIHSLKSEIESNAIASKYLQVVFLEDYSVTLAEKLIPAADVSEQISIAGKEASGTGNMKFMLNGAITLGTLDGANVEICDVVGRENIYIFGMTSDEVKAKFRNYAPHKYYEQNDELRRVLDHLRDGIGVGIYRESYADIAGDLLNKDSYMLLADFEDYCRVSNIISRDYSDDELWYKKSLMNIANAGRFSADRSVMEYASKNLEHHPD